MLSIFIFFIERFHFFVLYITENLEPKERLIILHSGSVNNSAPSFKNLPGISSMLHVLLGSILISILQILSRFPFINLKELEGIFIAEQYLCIEFSPKIFLLLEVFRLDLMEGLSKSSYKFFLSSNCVKSFSVDIFLIFILFQKARQQFTTD